MSGRIDRPTVHFEAPPREGLDQRLNEFIQWFNTSKTDALLDPLIRAGIVHLNWIYMRGQRKVLNRLLDGGGNGFGHGISASQYQKVAKVSKATVTCHLTDLLEKGCIVKMEGGGKNTRYWIKPSI